ncbi:NADPH-dependent curcumin reductase CurA [Bradyrhizobium sp. USDA 4011]
MVPKSNRQVLLKSRPVGIPQASHFEVVETPLVELASGQFLVRNRFLSIDPAMRGWTNPTQNYSKPVALGSVMRSFAVGEVVASRHDGFAVGDAVVGMLGWQEYALTDGANVRYKVVDKDLPLSTFLGVLGLNGFTAYLGLTEFCVPKPGDTFVVSSASGAVGSAAGQIASIYGCRTIGITGGRDKVKVCLDQFGFDAAVDYRSPDFEERLKEAVPTGVDVYFDNTSGSISDAVIKNLANGARVAICGTASIADWEAWPTGPRVERHLLVKRARMQGFVNLDYDHQYDEAVRRLATWVRNGRLRYREDIREGLETAPSLIAELYEGTHTGKLLVKL